MSEMTTKLSFLMDGSGEGTRPGKNFSWKAMSDGTWEFQNGMYPGRGHYIVSSYGGAAGRAGYVDHELRVGYVMGVRGGQCWKVSEGTDTGFDCFGIAMGWYDDTDGVFVQGTGVIKGLHTRWVPGGRVVVPALYGLPEQPTRRRQPTVLGIAKNERDLLLLPQLV